jgi:hypothetical protein
VLGLDVSAAGQLINFEARVPVLGFNVPEALRPALERRLDLPRRAVQPD